MCSRLASEDSDVDIFVLLKKRTWEAESLVSDTAFETNLVHDLFISPTVYGEDEYSDPILSETPFLQRINNEGISI